MSSGQLVLQKVLPSGSISLLLLIVPTHCALALRLMVRMLIHLLAPGSEYTTGVTTSGTAGQAGAYVQITVANSAPTLYYYCTNHSGMGGTANTP